MAADLRRTLGIPVETVAGHYGEFTVLVDGEPVVSGGPLAFLGVLPTTEHVRTTVAHHLDSESEARAEAAPDSQS